MDTPTSYTLRSRRDDGGIIALKVSDENVTLWSIDGVKWSPLYAYLRRDSSSSSGEAPSSYEAGDNIFIKGNIISAVDSVYTANDPFLSIVGSADSGYQISTQNIQDIIENSNSILISKKANSSNRSVLNINIDPDAPLFVGSSGLTVNTTEPIYISSTGATKKIALRFDDTLTLRTLTDEFSIPHSYLSVNSNYLQRKLHAGQGILLDDSNDTIQTNIEVDTNTGLGKVVTGSSSGITFKLSLADNSDATHAIIKTSNIGTGTATNYLCFSVDSVIFDTDFDNNNAISLKFANNGGIGKRNPANDEDTGGLYINCDAPIFSDNSSLNILKNNVDNISSGAFTTLSVDRLYAKNSLTNKITVAAGVLEIPEGSIQVSSGDVVAQGHRLTAKQNAFTIDASGLNLSSSNVLSIKKVLLGNPTQTAPANSIISGDGNTIDSLATGILVVGSNNTVRNAGTVMLGNGLIEDQYKGKGVVIGTYNTINTDEYLLMVGNGTGASDTERSTALQLDKYGDLEIKGDFSWTSFYVRHLTATTEDVYSVVDNINNKSNSLDLILNETTGEFISLKKDSRTYLKTPSSDITYSFDNTNLIYNYLTNNSYSFEFTLIIQGVTSSMTVNLPSSAYLGAGVSRRVGVGLNVYKVLLIGFYNAASNIFTNYYFINKIYIETPENVTT